MTENLKLKDNKVVDGPADTTNAIPNTLDFVKAQNITGDLKTGAHIAVAEPKATPDVQKNSDMKAHSDIKVQNMTGDVKVNVPRAGYVDAKAATPGTHNVADVKANVPRAGYVDTKAATPGTHNVADVKANIPKSGYADVKAALPGKQNAADVRAQNVAGDVKTVSNAGYAKPKIDAPDTLKYAAGVKPLSGSGNTKIDNTDIKIQAQDAGSGKSNAKAIKTELL
jgi:hypothetical protein